MKTKRTVTKRTKASKTQRVAPVAIIVVPADRYSLLPRCLDAIYRHTHIPFRVIVVDAGADRFTHMYLQRQEKQNRTSSAVLTVVHLDGMASSGTVRNAGLAHVKERYCAIVENDITVRENWLAPMVACAKEERSAVVGPAIVDMLYNRIHAIGCMFDPNAGEGRLNVNDTMISHDQALGAVPLQRVKIDYPERHCLLLDRKQLPEKKLFDDVEPFDADLGLILRKKKLKAFFEPGSVVEFMQSPPIELTDLPHFKRRWDFERWIAERERFVQKWNVEFTFDEKRKFYHSQHRNLLLARWFPNSFTLGMGNHYTLSKRKLRAAVLDLLGK